MLCLLKQITVSLRICFIILVLGSYHVLPYAQVGLSNRCVPPYEIFDDKSQSCICREGFSGWNCGMCNSNSSSSASIDPCLAVDSALQCHAGLDYVNNTVMKTYDCDLDPSLASLFDDGAIAVKCNRSAAVCNIGIYKRKRTIHSEHVIDCNTTGCSFIEGKADVNCEKIMCVCGTDCAALTKTIVEKVLSGNPMNMTCDEHVCDINIKSSPIALRGICQASECVRGNSSNSSSGGGSPTRYSGMILALVLSFSGLLIFFACCCTALRKRRSHHHFVKKTASINPSNLPGKKLEFKNICSTVRIKSRSDPSGSRKSILHNVSGSISRGRVLGLLGPSGSGKTSLLNALANVHNGDSVLTGDIRVDNSPRMRSYRRIAAYVQQDDDLISTLSVRECIQYSAQLRLPHYMSYAEKEEMVDKVIYELGLDHVATSKVGQSWGSRGVSGGERRRVSIGMELVTSPQILFLDEPTSGLDSYTANSILCTVTQLARHGRIVVLSVHQPSAKAFMQLDQVLLLAKGHVMYRGSPMLAADFFDGAGFPCPKGENIADHMLDVVSSAEGVQALRELNAQPNEANVEEIELVVDEAVKSDALVASPSPQGHSDGETSAMLRLNSSEALAVSNDYEYSRSICNELHILFRRTAINILRHPSLLCMHLIIALSLALGGGFVFYKVTNDLAGFQNRTGAFYFILTFFGFATFSSMDLFIRERSIFMRETGAKYYGAFSYFLAKSFLDSLTLRILPCILFGCIFYALMQLKPVLSSFLIFLITLTLFNLVAGSICMCISVICPTVGAANLIATVVFLVMLLFGGFLLNVQTMPTAVSWLKYVSIFNYAFEVLMTNELLGITLTFDAPGYPKVPVKGEVFLATLGMDYRNITVDLIGLGVMFIGYLSMGYLLLLLRVPQGDKQLREYNKETLPSL